MFGFVFLFFTFEYFTHIGSHHFRWRVGLISISIIYSLYAQCSTLWNYQAKGICRLQAGWLIVHDPFIFKSFIEDLIMTTTEIFWYTVPTRYCEWEWLAIRWHMQGLLGYGRWTNIEPTVGKYVGPMSKMTSGKRHLPHKNQRWPNEWLLSGNCCLYSMA